MAENIKRHITHIKSKVVESSNPKLPTASQIEYGEIAVNYAKGYETISIKNESGDVVTFSEDKNIGKKGKLTGYAKASSASAVATGDTINTAIGKLEKALDGKQPSGSYVTTGRKVSTASGLTGGGDLSADRTIGLVATGTAGTYGPAADVTGTEGTTIKVPQITTDAYGRVTAVTERTYTSKNSTYTVNNGTFTVSGNGTSVATMTANQSGNSGVIITGGTNVTVTPDATNHKISISAVDTTYDAMSAAELSAGTATTKRTMTAANIKTGGDAIWQAKGSYLTGTTKYAGSSTQGGAATSAAKLTNTSSIGSLTNPVFFTAGGVPSACTYSLNKTVPSDAVFTDTKVTAVGNHYTPTATSADTKSATASSTAELAWGSAVVTGVTLSGDAKGHITSVTVASGKLKTPVTGVTLASGTNNGTVKLTVNGSATDNIAVKGLGTAAYKAEGYFAGSGHTHTNMVTGSSLTSNDIILGNGSSAIKASGKSIETTLSSTLDTKVPTSKAVADYVTSQMTSVLTYKGSISSNDTLKNAHKVGDVYVVSSAGTYAGKACEVGDYLIANTARESASTVTNADWDAINGENQVENKGASLAAAGSSATIATVDGTNLTITTPSTWTGVAKTGTVTKVSTGAGLTGGDITSTGTIKCALSSETKSTLAATAMGSTASRQYAVGLDKNGVLSVNVPWTNTNNGYVPTGRTITTASGLTGGGDLSANRTIGLVATGTSGTYGPTADVTGSNNTTIKVPQITTDAYGRVTAVTERTYTSVDHTYTVNNGTFTISGAGTAVASTSANASANTGVNIKAGTNVTITTGTNEITIAATDTKYTAATAAPPKVATASASGTSTNYARQDHTHGIDLATGDSNGQVKIAGQNISVKGLGGAAYLNTGTTTGTVADGGHNHNGTYAKNAFSRIAVNSTNVDADSTGDTFTITAGTFVSLTGDATNDKMTIGVSTGTSSTTLARGDHQSHYWANLQTSSAANYITEPEIKSVKINGSSTNAASTNNCQIQYDTTNKCLKFLFN